MTDLIVKPAKSLTGEISIPGDKSISHRAVMLGALAQGVTKVNDFLMGDDCLATIRCLQQLGAEITNYKLQMTNGKEMDIQLPGPGEYVLTATAPDYMPLRIAVPLDEKVVSSEVLLGPWTRMARLQLEMPELAQGTITRLRLKPNDPDGEAAEQTIEGDELSGKKIVELPIAPGTRYMVIVEAKGQRNFSRRTPPLQSGELRTIKVYFE